MSYPSPLIDSKAYADMVEMEKYDGQAQEFIDTMKDLTHEWGFIFVCTATNLTEDKLAICYTSLCGLIHANQDPAAEMDPHTLALPLMHLPGADVPAARAAFNDWIDAYDDVEEDWDSDVLRDVFLLVDNTAAKSFLAVGRIEVPWVVVVDAKYTESGRARQDYPGYVRCLARSLCTLSDELQNGDEGLEALSPARQYADQIPLFDGSPRGKVLEPEKPPKGERVEFSRGTPRGGTGGAQRGVQGGT